MTWCGSSRSITQLEPLHFSSGHYEYGVRSLHSARMQFEALRSSGGLRVCWRRRSRRKPPLSRFAETSPQMRESAEFGENRKQELFMKTKVFFQIRICPSPIFGLRTWQAANGGG